jgi:hypothetical protein
VFYVIIFSIMAVVLVAGGIAAMVRRSRYVESEEHQAVPSKTDRKKQSKKRKQSRKARRKR